MANTVQPITVAEQRFIWAERQQESGGNYQATNPSGAMGAYQILSSNLSSWEREAGLPQESGTVFLNDRNEQDALAIYKLGGYFQKYGDAGAAAMWYSGQPDPTKSYGNPPVSTYVHDVLALENQAPSTGLPGGVGVAGGTSSGTGTTAAQPASVSSSILGSILGAMGINGPDFLERAGLIILGGILLVIGIIKFSGTDKKAIAGAKAGLAFETRGIA
jgi:hypothetical protein